MNNGMAVYELACEGEPCRVRFFLTPEDEVDQTPLEDEVSDIICRGFAGYEGVISGEYDPFKAAEEILADHYGYAKMVESHYTWIPHARY